MTIHGVIWDIDGTLFDSNEAHVRTWIDALEVEGIFADSERVRELVGMGGDNLLPILTGIHSESEEGKRILERKQELFRVRELPELEPFSKVRELLGELNRRGLKQVVATSAKREELKIFLRILGIEEFIQDSSTVDDAKNSKPDPDLIHAALAQLGLDPEVVVMVGDTRWDIEAARKARVRTIAFESGGHGVEELRGAIRIYRDAADLLSQLDCSPFSVARLESNQTRPGQAA